jgi:hypothetical protein
MPVALMLFVFLSSVSLAAEPDDYECVAGEATAAFSAKVNGATGYKRIKSKKDLDLTEKFQLQNGTSVTVTQGGCAHFGRSVSFTIPKTKLAKETAKEMIARAIGLLNQLPKPNSIAKDLHDSIELQKKALLKAKIYDQDGKFGIESTNENGYVTIGLEASEAKGSLQFLISEDIAL